MNNRALKTKAANSLRSALGFAPAQKDIILLEAHGDLSYIRFRVKFNEYNIVNDTLALLDPENNEVMIWMI